MTDHGEIHADYLGHARRLGERLLASARVQPDGSLTWGRGADRDRQPVVDSGPVSGRCGEAYFFAALARATGEAVFEESALGALAGIREGVDHGVGGDAGPRATFAALLTRLRLGVAGVGGMIYVLVRTGQRLDRPELIDDARSLARFLSTERIEADTTYDVSWGVAGALLGLLALADTGSERALGQAEACGRHLLARRTLDERSGLRAWKTLRELPSTGFAHGACGIAHALLRLHLRTGDLAFRDAALEAFAFERALYREDLDHWQEWWGHTETHPRFTSWCHGAPGVGLSRLTSLECLDAEHEVAVVRDLQLALRATANARTPTVDTLCCGYFGRIDILLEAGARLENDSLTRQARRLADLRLERAGQEGFHNAMSPEPTPLLGGFWQGEAGIGYTLLRLARPRSLPCILSMA
ncbi:MAG: hypothetical protein MI919_26490 [Holophagales bacterium]|nr:hypothetical protein [Holophagales bacterium]